MKLEEAKELYSAGNPGPSHPRFKAWVAAENFLDGHASRDPEVEKLQREIDQMKKMFPNWTFEKKQLEAELSAERKAVEKLKAEIANHSSISRKLVDMALPVIHSKEPADWKWGFVPVDRSALENLHKAINPFLPKISDIRGILKDDATAGHSPEGKE